MKKTLFSLIIILTTSVCFSQSIDNQVNKYISDSLSKLPSDSIKYKITNSKTSVYADTLQIPVNTTAMYDIAVIYRDVTTGQILNGWKRVTIQRSGSGAYFIVDDPTTTGTIMKANWTVIPINGLVLIKITALTINTVKWALLKYLYFSAPQ